jgi:hypothetical protein
MLCKPRLKYPHFLFGSELGSPLNFVFPIIYTQDGVGEQATNVLLIEQKKRGHGSFAQVLKP